MIIDEIIKSKKEALSTLKEYITLEVLMDKMQRAKPPRDFIQALIPGKGQQSAIRIIAEIKKASPSRGVIRDPFHPFDIARTYESNGAAALSVLTEEKYFQGRLDYLVSIRIYSKIPVLRKDFIFEEYQVYETRAAGADAILLIASILEKEELKNLMGLSASLGMAALVEVHDEKELETALGLGARLIGVNNRDLKTFKTDINTTIRLAPYIPKDVTLVSESGIYTIEDIVKLLEAGVNAFLIGEALMREENIGKKLKELRGLGQG